MEIDFRNINFGCSDAHTESEDYPELLSKGYMDLSNVINQALYRSTFLFLGYKGSGKSSLSEHLRMIDDKNIKVDTQRLTNFSFSAFSKILNGNNEKEIRAQETWRWILCVKVLQNLIKDDEAHSDNENDVNKAIDLLTQSGLFPLVEVSSLVATTSTTHFKATIKAFEFERENRNENVAVNITMATNFIKNLIGSYKECHSHFIVIDDLDDILHPNGTQYTIISALINEVQDLNRFFKKNNVPVKILVLCRMDIFDRLRDPNKNKIKQDSSYNFIWYREGVDEPHSNPLVSLVNIRSKLVYPDVNDVFKKFFPRQFHDTQINKALLDYTRHTPRDFIELLNYIQKQCSKNKVTIKDIENGVSEYSTEYFIHEINDEMSGYIQSEDSAILIKCLSALRSRDFKFKDLENLYVNTNSSCTREKLIEDLKVLYDCSAIGHVFSYDGGRTERVAFKYRNRNSSFSEKDRILLHKGLWKALNVNY